MNETRQNPSAGRQLAAILFADIAGYTALMQKDEATASNLLRRFQKELEKKVAENNGNIVNFYGDGALCVFPVPIDAVRCAMELQTAFGVAPRVPVRIGLHSGTVTYEGDKIFGDSVNLASRIESMGIPGAVLFSKKIRDDIKNNPDLKIRLLGSFAFKNVEEEMEVFALANDGFAIPKRKEMKGKLQPESNLFNRWLVSALAIVLLALTGWWGWGKMISTNDAGDVVSTIAVLPFSNLSTDPKNEFYSSGVHEDILNKLAGLQNLKVISRTSVVKYRDSEEDLKDIGKRLGARYIVEGSVMRMEDQVRVMARLFDASTDQSLWSEEYNSTLSDVFGLQSSIAQKIANTLKTKINEKEKNQLNAVLTRTPEAYDNFIKARNILNASRVPYEKLKQAIGLLNKAVAADGQFNEGWALLAIAESELSAQEREFDGKEEEARLAADRAEAALQKAQALNPESAVTLRAQGYFQLKVKEDEISALRSYDQALEANPNDYETLLDQGMMYIYMGKSDRALSNFTRAFDLNKENGFVNYMLKTGYDMSRQYEKIPPLLELLLELEPEKTHYKVEAAYFQFLADGSLESFHAFEDAVQRVERTEKCDTRTVQDNQAVVAMVNGDFESYFNYWTGTWDRHHASHGNWSCPMILNDETNQARLLIEYGNEKLAAEIIETAKTSATRPINENSVCIFDKQVLEPKLDFLSGDSLQARRKFETMVSKVMQNNKFPRGAVEKMVLLQTADMVAPDRVYDIYQEVMNAPVSIVGMEKICADPFTYPNLLKHPKFLAEVRQDGRFVGFLEHYDLHRRGLIPAGHHHHEEGGNSH